MREQQPRARVHSWLAAPLAADVAQSLERLARAEDVEHVAIMPDVHLASDVCVGVALATRRLIYPAAVGSDIGCGMAAIRFAAGAGLLADERAAARVLAGLYECVPAIKHPQEHVAEQLLATLRDAALSDPHLEKLKARDGRYQLGTLGRGNHFVELQADEDDCLWLMVHSGSRGIGQAITAHHVRAARKADRAGGLLSLEADAPAGRAYLADLAWAIRYAQENRLQIVRAVAGLLQKLFGVASLPDSLIHADHNHVRRETHGDHAYWVHRKGALSAALDEPGVIPGSMGTASFHVAGRGEPGSLRSSSHGAGRALSRSEASRRIHVRQFERDMRGVWFDHRRVSSLRDEAPSAYKDIHAVMRAQCDLTRIVRELRPVLSYKGV